MTENNEMLSPDRIGEGIVAAPTSAMDAFSSVPKETGGLTVTKQNGWEGHAVQVNAASGADTVTVTLPSEFSSVRFPCVYAFDRKQKTPMLVTVAGQYKNVVGYAPTVNVSDYYRYDFRFEPIVGGVFRTTEAALLKRLVGATVGFNVGGASYRTERVSLSDASVGITARKGLLTDIRLRHIGRGQVDEFTLVSEGHTLAVENGRHESLIRGDLRFANAVCHAADERFALTPSTGAGDCDAVAVRVRVTLGENVTDRQVLFMSDVTAGCIVRLENGTLYIGTNAGDTAYRVNRELRPYSELDVWIVMLNTDTIAGVGSGMMMSVVVDGEDASFTSPTVTAKRICVGGLRLTSSLRWYPFRGVLRGIDVHRIDDDPDGVYELLIAVFNPEASGSEAILANSLIAAYAPEGFDPRNGLWHERTVGGPDLTLEGEIGQEETYRIPHGMQVVALPIAEDCRAILTDPTTGRQETIAYRCHEHVSGVRLAWVNRYGAIDSYDFEVVAEESLELEKTSIYTETGYFTTDVAADEYTTVTTRALPSAELKAMTDLLVSDHVFMIGENGISEVDVVSDSATTRNHNALTVLTVRFRPKKRLA